MRQIMQWLFVGVVAVMMTACGGGGSGELTAIQKIATYARDGGTAPTVQMYADAGVTGVTEENLDEINAVVAGLNYEDVDTATEVQMIVDRLGLDITNPIFTSAATVSVPENQTTAITLQATDSSMPITYSISGGESADFDIDTTTGVVTFKTAPDFETQDSYGFTVTATDSAGNSATQDVTITITDVPEGKAPKKTGQIQSYDENGTAITDGSLKDDGFYQKGTTLSYTRDDAKEVVTDHITGLIWQDDADANSTQKQWLTDTNYDTCDNNHSDPACYDTSGDTAATYCADLTLGGYGDWRLPTSKELMGIVDRSKRYPAIDTSYFQHVVSDYYWSSTTFVGYEGYAWGVGFDYGGDDWRNKSYSYYVRCVRDGQQ